MNERPRTVQEHLAAGGKMASMEEAEKILSQIIGQPNMYEVVVERDGDEWTAALFPVTGGARDSMIETGSGPTPRQALIDLTLTFTWDRD